MIHQKESAGKILDRFFDRAAKPSPEQMELSRQQVLRRLNSEPAHTPMEVRQVRVQKPRRSLVAAVAVAVVVVAVGTMAILRNWGVETQTSVAAVDGVMIRISHGESHAVRIGERIEGGSLIRSDRGGELTLADESLIEMGSNSELALEAASDGVRIRLNTGSVIVTAAKQRTGHLYVQTKDVTVSVVGTVFFVNAEQSGSRVAVVQGEVHVQQGQTTQKLFPGEQIATEPTMPTIPVAEEIAWSRSADSHLALMQRVTTIDSPQLTFEVASLKVHDPGDHTPDTIWFLPGGRFTATNVSLGHLIRIAYNVRSSQVSGGPGWIDSQGGDRYDIEAHAEAGSFPPGQPDRALVDKLRLMVQALLAERFKLALKRDVKQLPVYALMVSKGGAKLQKSTRDCDAAPGACHGFIGGRGRGFTAKAMDMSDLANALMLWTDRPVQDRTGIQGTFDFEVPPWTNPSQLSSQGVADGREPAPDPSRPDMFTTLQESIGLKLEAQTGPVELLIIESAERPSGN